MKKILYKVYCGKNGKFYTYIEKSKAENLFYKLSNQNYRTELIKIENGKATVIAEYK